MTTAVKRTPRNYYQGRSGWKLPEPERHGRLAPRDSFVASHDSIVWPSSHLVSMAREDALRCVCVLAWYAPVGTVVHDTYAHRLRRHPRARRGRVTKARKAGTTFGGRRPSHTKRRCTHEVSSEWSNLERRFKLRRDAKPGNHHQVPCGKTPANIRFAGEGKASKRVGCSCGLTTSEEGLTRHWREVLAGPKPEQECDCCFSWEVDDKTGVWEQVESCDGACDHEHHPLSVRIDRASQRIDAIVLMRFLVSVPSMPEPKHLGGGAYEVTDPDPSRCYRDSLCGPWNPDEARLRYARWRRACGYDLPLLTEATDRLHSLLHDLCDDLRSQVDDPSLYLPLVVH